MGGAELSVETVSFLTKFRLVLDKLGDGRTPSSAEIALRRFAAWGAFGALMAVYDWSEKISDSRRAFGMRLFRVSRPFGRGWDESFGRVKAAWQFLRSTCRCDLIILRHVPEGSLLHSVLQSGNAQPHSTLTNLRVSFDNHENWQSYYRSTPANDRRDNERRRRRLGTRKGRIRSGRRLSRPADDRVGAKTESSQLPQDDRARRWLQIANPERDLLVGVSSRGGPEGRLAIFVLKIDDAVAATIIGRVDLHRVEAMTTTYDATYREFAPGKLLLAECLKWAAHNKLEFDLRGGDFPYKRRWANCELMIHDYKHGNSAFYAISVRLPFAVPILRWCRRLAGQRRTTKSEETT